jgi:hypothetical protein
VAGTWARQRAASTALSCSLPKLALTVGLRSGQGSAFWVRRVSRNATSAANLGKMVVVTSDEIAAC